MDRAKTYQECANLTEFFESYGPVLAQKATAKLNPLHIPGKHPIRFNYKQKFPRGDFLRLPYEPQANVIEAMVKSLEYQSQAWCVAEPGTGKTLMGACTAHAHANGRGYRGIVMCPTHMTRKWKREIERTVPNALVYNIRDWREVLSMVPETVPHKFNIWPEAEDPEWYIIGRNRAKLGLTWHTAIQERKGLRGSYTLRCPQCGQVLKNSDGDPMKLDQVSSNRAKLFCENEIEVLTGSGNDAPAFVKVPCGARLWQYDTEKFYRWPPANIIKDKLNGYFDYCVLDELHEYKGADTAQANAAGDIAKAAKNVITLTGTLIGGYATHIFYITWRLMPRTLVEAGYSWTDSLAFCQEYGKVERIIKTTPPDGSKKRSNKNSKGGTQEVQEKPAPGILPNLFGEHVMGHAVFLGLAEMASNLPKLKEETFEYAMDDELAEAMAEVNEELVPIACELAAQGNMKVLGLMMEVLLYYPDHPWGWGEIGYEDPLEGYVPIMTPRTLSSDVVRAKEQAMIDHVRGVKKRGHQCWIYIQRNGERDVLARLEKLMGLSGFRVETLRSTVSPEKREEWIEAKGKDVDVMISHPQLVETGLDLFVNKKNGHNYNDIQFYQTGYRTFTIMQAGRRAWRLSQRRKCWTGYHYWKGTAQEGAMNHVGHKMKAMWALQGQYSEEGLAAMCGDGDGDAMSLAKQLSERLVGTGDTTRLWQQVTQDLGSVYGDGAEFDEEHDEEEESSTGVEINDDIRAQFWKELGGIIQPAVKFDVVQRIHDIADDIKKGKSPKGRRKK